MHRIAGHEAPGRGIPDGANFTQCRAPIGANVFSLGWYSLNETPGDYEMKNFSIDRNRQELITYSFKSHETN